MEIKFGHHSCYFGSATCLYMPQEPGLFLLHHTFSACMTVHRDHDTPHLNTALWHCSHTLTPLLLQLFSAVFLPCCSAVCRGLLLRQNQGGFSAYSQFSLFGWIGLLVQVLPQYRGIWESLAPSWILVMSALSIFPSTPQKSVFKNNSLQGQNVRCLSHIRH